MKKECSINRDLLPLYLEGQVSTETANYIKAHLDTCDECSAELEVLSAPSKIDYIAAEEVDFGDSDAVALKILKHNRRRKIVLNIIKLLILVLIILGIYDFAKPTTISYGTSEIYSKQDMDDAIDLIKERIYNIEGIVSDTKSKIYSISYTNDDICQQELNEHKGQAIAKYGVPYSECIVFKTEMRPPLFGDKHHVLNSYLKYSWGWTLGRIDDGDWEVITFGEGYAF